MGGNIEAVEAAVHGHEFRGEGKRMDRLKFFLVLALLVLVLVLALGSTATGSPTVLISGWHSMCRDCWSEQDIFLAVAQGNAVTCWRRLVEPVQAYMMDSFEIFIYL